MKNIEGAFMEIRRREDRGQVNIGWLKSAHTFSFGHYYDPHFMGYGALRVINDDYIEGGMGFETHPHKDMEIITFIKEGALEHKDSMGNHSVIRPGEIQIMSAGTGVYHSEINHYKDRATTLYQIWIQTNAFGIEPSYQQKSYLDFKEENGLTLLASPNAELNSVKIHQNAKLFLASFKGDEKSEFKTEARPVWIQIISGEIEIENEILRAGDGVAFNQNLIQWKALEESEFLIFEL